MKKMTVIEKILCVFKPKKTTTDILSEAENIINQYISDDNNFEYLGNDRKKSKANLALNLAIVISLVVLAFLSFKVLG
jgi:hypothetical protein